MHFKILFLCDAEINLSLSDRLGHISHKQGAQAASSKSRFLVAKPVEANPRAVTWMLSYQIVLRHPALT